VSDPFVGEIRIFTGNFAPRGWAFCDGQLIPISQNTALFSLLGTMYGGDGRSTFALPDLRGRLPMGTGQGPGLTPRPHGSLVGSETVALLASEAPPHGHALTATSSAAGTDSPAGASLAEGDEDNYRPGPTTVDMAPTTSTGSGQPHNNLQPYQTCTFIIALQGIFPPRS
jgi:microcystin-dependent protein